MELVAAREDGRFAEDDMQLSPGDDISGVWPIRAGAPAGKGSGRRPSAARGRNPLPGQHTLLGPGRLDSPTARRVPGKALRRGGRRTEVLALPGKVGWPGRY